MNLTFGERHSGSSKLAKAFAALVPSILVLATAEVILRALGYGFNPDFFLKLKREGQVFLTENHHFAWRFMPPATARAPLSFQFPENKPQDSFRVFVFGESAAMGDPEPAFGFSRILKVLLEAAYPDRKFEVINTAFPAINSHVIREIARDCAKQKGDVWIIYMGNNEVLGPYGATPTFGASAPTIAAVRSASFLSRYRIGQFVGELARKLRGRQFASSTQLIELLLSRPVPMDDPVLERIYAHFESNLRAIVRTGIKARSRVFLNTVVSNLKDCGPFIEGDPAPLTPEQRTKWERAFNEGVGLLGSGRTKEALGRFLEAAALSTNHAGLQFQMGRAHLALGDTNSAKRHLQLARDMDAFRARADSRINEIIRRIANEYPGEKVQLIDAERAFAGASQDGITGTDFMCDHVHFNFSGNYLLARLQAQAISSSFFGSTGERVEWLDQNTCARRLGLTDWNRYRFAVALQRQLSGDLFRRLVNHRELETMIQREIRSLLSANDAGTVGEQLAIYKDAIRANPEDWVLHDLLGNFLLGHSDRAGAIAACSNAVRIAPHSFTPRYKLGLLLNTPETAQKALPHLLAARQLRPMLPEVHAALGTAYTHLKKFEEADRSFRRAVCLDPSNEHAHIAWSESFLARGSVEQAARQLRQIIAANSNSLQAHIRLGLYYASRNQSNEAMHHFKEALRIDPRNETARRHTVFPRDLPGTGEAPR